MKNYNNCKALPLFMLLVSSSVIASDEEPNPSDPTAVRTAVTAQVYDDYSGNVILDMSGAYTEDFSYMIQAKGEWNDDFEYKGSRLQFYNLIATGNAAIPRTGISLDYITMYEDVDTIDVSMYAIGSISIIPITPDFEYSFSPQIAYLQSTFDFKEGNPFGFKSSSHETSGVLFAGYLTQKFDSGAFIMIWPEYYKLSGNNMEYEDRQIQVAYGAPMTKDKSWWYMIQYQFGNTEMSVGDQTIAIESNKLSLKIRMHF